VTERIVIWVFDIMRTLTWRLVQVETACTAILFLANQISALDEWRNSDAQFRNAPSDGAFFGATAILLVDTITMRPSQQQRTALIGAISAVVTTVLTSTAAAAVAALQSLTWDGRSGRRAPSKGHSIRVSQFPIADSDSWFDEGWLRSQFRCNKLSFDKIVEFITVFWDTVNSPSLRDLAGMFCITKNGIKFLKSCFHQSFDHFVAPADFGST